jgi:hypothetical protein
LSFRFVSESLNNQLDVIFFITITIITTTTTQSSSPLLCDKLDLARDRDQLWLPFATIALFAF